MSCPKNHEQIASKYCPDCGVMRIDRIEMIVAKSDKDIAKELNEIVREVVKETGDDAFYREKKPQHVLFFEKIVKRQLGIPKDRMFIITGDYINHIFTMDEVYQSYPFLRNIDIKQFAAQNNDLQKMFSFLYASGVCRDDKYYNGRFETIAAHVADEDYKQCGLSVVDFMDDKYARCSRLIDELKAITSCNKSMTKYALRKALASIK